MLTRKIGYMVIGGLLALGIVFGGAAVLAQVDNSESDSAESDSAEETPAETEETTPSMPGFGLGGPHGSGGFRFDSSEKSEALAEALGITVEELEAAREEAFAVIVAQAVADGTLTQEQADELLESGSAGACYLGLGHGRMSSTHQQYLADALGISVEELEAAYDDVMAAQLAEMVEGGVITQEEADMIVARDAVRDRLDYDALSAAAQEAYEAAVAQALADGEITQEQADALLSESGDYFGPFGGGFWGPGGGHRRGGRGHHGGGMNGSGFFQNSAPAAEDVDA